MLVMSCLSGAIDGARPIHTKRHGPARALVCTSWRHRSGNTHSLSDAEGVVDGGAAGDPSAADAILWTFAGRTAEPSDTPTLILKFQIGPPDAQ